MLYSLCVNTTPVVNAPPGQPMSAQPTSLTDLLLAQSFTMGNVGVLRLSLDNLLLGPSVSLFNEDGSSPT